MFRRKALVPIFLVFALVSLMAATSFSSASIQANGKLSIVDTDNGLVALLPGTVSTIKDHRLVLNLTGDGNAGLQTNSTYTFRHAFTIKNNDDRTITVKYNGDLLSQYGDVETKAYVPEANHYYNNALEDGFTLESGESADIMLIFHVGNKTVNIDNADFQITATQGSHNSSNPPIEGAIPQDTNDGDNGGGTPPPPGSDDGIINCDTIGHCQQAASDLLEQLEQLRDWLNDHNAHQYYNLANDWFNNLNQSVNSLKVIVDRINDNEHNELSQNMQDINSVVIDIVQRLQEIKSTNS